MFMHILYFGTYTDAEKAEKWLKDNLDGIASSATCDYEPYMCKFYTAIELSESQQKTIADTVKPTATMMNEKL